MTVLRAGCAGSRNGFTLMEVMVAVMVTAMILSIVYSSFGRTIESKEYVEKGNEAYHKARWAMDKIAGDLACAYVHKATNANSIFYALSHEVNGMPMDEVHFTSFSHIQQNPLAAESDQCELSYKVAWVPEVEKFQLWRREDATVDESNMNGGEELMLVDDIVAFNLRFWDGYAWQDQWDSRPLEQLAEAAEEEAESTDVEFEQTDEMIKASPAAVELTVAVPGPDGRPIVFTSKVKIEMSTISLKAADEGDDDDQSGGSSGGEADTKKESNPLGAYLGAG